MIYDETHLYIYHKSRSKTKNLVKLHDMTNTMPNIPIFNLMSATPIVKSDDELNQFMSLVHYQPKN